MASGRHLEPGSRSERNIHALLKTTSSHFGFVAGQTALGNHKASPWNDYTLRVIFMSIGLLPGLPGRRSESTGLEPPCAGGHNGRRRWLTHGSTSRRASTSGPQWLRPRAYRSEERRVGKECRGWLLWW